MTCKVMIGAVSTASVVSMVFVATAILVPMILGMVFLRKKIIGQIVLFSLFAGMVCFAEIWWLAGAQPEASATLAVRQLNGDNSSAMAVRMFDAGQGAVQLLAAGAILLAGLLCFSKEIASALGKLKGRWFKAKTVIALGLVSLFGLTGCMKSYDRPEYVEIDTSETGFLIPLEGDGTQQARFQSEDYLKQRKVATKRVQILHRWSQEGRISNDGRWIPTVRLVKVNRSPVTREWITDQSSQVASQGRTRSDKAIWIESADSVGFSMGFTCTAFIRIQAARWPT
jgi:hypothetical protein